MNTYIIYILVCTRAYLCTVCGRTESSVTDVSGADFWFFKQLLRTCLCMPRGAWQGRGQGSAEQRRGLGMAGAGQGKAEQGSAGQCRAAQSRGWAG